MTEVAAFQAQEIILEYESNDIVEFLCFLQLFHGRLYALRVLHDRQRWLRRCELDQEFMFLTKEFLGVVGLVPATPISKLVAIDFLFAFSYFYKMAKRAKSWKELVASISNLNNSIILNSQGALLPMHD